MIKYKSKFDDTVVDIVKAEIDYVVYKFPNFDILFVDYSSSFYDKYERF